MPGPALTPIATPLPVAPTKGPEGARPDAAASGREAEAPDTGFAGELQRRMQGDASSETDTTAKPARGLKPNTKRPGWRVASTKRKT